MIAHQQLDESTVERVAHDARELRGCVLHIRLQPEPDGVKAGAGEHGGNGLQFKWIGQRAALLAQLSTAQARADMARLGGQVSAGLLSPSAAASEMLATLVPKT